MKKIYIERLRKLAVHLDSGQLKIPIKPIVQEPTIEDNGEYIEEILHFFLIHDLAYLFPDWIVDDEGVPYWTKDVQKHPVSSIMLFFNLSFFEFTNIFMPGTADSTYGYVLRKDSSAKEIAHNIFLLIGECK